MSQKIRLTECGTMECGAVDEARPVIPHVKILGWQSKNRRQYLPESVNPRDYEDINVNLNHTEGPNKQRLVQERFGWFENVVKEADGLYGDLHYNPELPYARPFAWWAKNKPSKIGMSHDAVGMGKSQNGVFIVEKATPKSVDLVADAATTNGLHEAMEPEVTPDVTDSGADDLDSLETHIKNAVAAICGDEALDLKAKVKKIKAALKLLEEPGAETEEEDDEPGDDDDGDVEESVKALAKTSPAVKKLVEAYKSAKSKGKAWSGDKSLLEKIDALEVKLATKERAELVNRLLAEASLPKHAITDRFKTSLHEAKDEKAIRELIADRKAVSTVQKPSSTGPLNEGKGASNVDNKTFAQSMKAK